MQYHGGKEMIAKDLVKAIQSYGAGCTHYLEPFMGGASIFARMAPLYPGRAIGADYDPDVAALWSAIASGEWEPPTELTREEYFTLKEDPVPSPLRAFAAFGCSFGAVKWSSYASSDPRPGRKSRAGAAHAGILKKRPGLMGASIAWADYRAFSPGPGTLVYADPPYAGTTGYDATGPWVPAEFWSTMTAWSKAGAVVLVSEYQAPDGWEEVWRREKRVCMAANENTRKATEKLFIHQSTAIRREQSTHLSNFYA